MRLRYPPPLARGALIGVTAPSSGVPPSMHTRLDIVLGHLRAQGFAVEEGYCLRTEVQGASAHADSRAAELTAMLLREDIAAIIPPWGGELAIELLDRLDWSALAKAKPKWLLGYSDTSTLLVAITLHLRWATAHGPCLMDLAPGQHDALTSKAMATLATPAGGQVLQQQSASWQLMWTDFEKHPETAFALTEPTRWACLNRSGAVRARGRLIGGCIDTLMHTAGSGHGDIGAFVAGQRDDGTILYLENAEQSPTALVRALHQLRWAGWFDGIAALLVGRSAAPDNSEPTELRYREALMNTLAALPCPVLVDVDIGHRPPQFTLINGALAEVHWSADEGGRVLQTLA